MSEFDPHRYTITVKRVFEDGEPMFKATVKELPHVAEYGNSYHEVYELAIDTIAGLREMAGDMKHPFPDPVEEDDNFSGRVTLRLPKSLHRRTAHMADIEGVSLNQFLVSTIAEKIGGSQIYASFLELTSHLVASNKVGYQFAPFLGRSVETRPENILLGNRETINIRGYESASSETPELLIWEQ